VPVESQLSYYQRNQFNPVPIRVDMPDVWESHVAKRRNLYERQLGIPLGLLKDRSVLEFGCNSGENALVLASFGARLTMVEPNEQVIPRLEALFAQFGLADDITALVQTDIDTFQDSQRYDLVLAEGFLHSLSNRDDILKKICGLLVPGGRAVISFPDRYGSLIEMTRRLVLWRAYDLSGGQDPHGEESLALSEALYAEDFAELAASRPFHAWWKDSLVDPLNGNESILWSYQELVRLIERLGCEFHSSSPKWDSVEHFNWYKNALPTSRRHQLLLEEWGRVFPFFLTGMRPSQSQVPAPDAEAVDAVGRLVTVISNYISSWPSSPEVPSYPPDLHRYLTDSKDETLIQFDSEMGRLYETVRLGDAEDLVSVYHDSGLLRQLWGVPYHYLSFAKLV